jgi:hypothetical protein
MRIQKPTFDNTNQVYTSAITEGIRCEAILDNQRQFTPPVTSFYNSIQETFLDSIIQQTKGWFKKPLTKDWLASRVVFHIPTEIISDDFEGTCIWELKQLSISKEKFDFTFQLVETKADEQLMISFEEPESVTLTRRREHKEKVLKLRAKASRAIFHAELATQEYCKVYGEDTDWEISDDENE